MNLFYPEHIVVLDKLLKCNVRFLLIGGYAVIAHGYMRTTGDLDIWICSSDENKKILLYVFRILGFEDAELETIQAMNFNEATVFSMGTNPQKIDFLTKVNQISFDEAYNNKTMIEFDNLELPFVRYQDLVLMKMITGRTKDKADIEELQKIKNQIKK